MSESATVVEVPLELISGESEVTLNVFTVDGTASGMESMVCLLHNTANAGKVFNERMPCAIVHPSFTCHCCTG